MVGFEYVGCGLLLLLLLCACRVWCACAGEAGAGLGGEAHGGGHVQGHVELAKQQPERPRPRRVGVIMRKNESSGWELGRKREGEGQAGGVCDFLCLAAQKTAVHY